MKNILDLIRRYIHPCLHCGSFLKSDGLLCESCRGLLNRYLDTKLVTRTLAIFDAHALFRWNPGTSDLLSAQLVGLKGTRSQADWAYWAQRFLSRRLSEGLPPRRIIIIPAPSKSGGRDHAYQWAEALAAITGAQVYPCLRKLRSQHQRGADRDKRIEVELELDENSSMVSDYWSETLWIFADDIVTTGSTALAAFEALGSPPHFETWALAHRTLACRD
jgi:predicted amidophosphoribosyltransferase